MFLPANAGRFATSSAAQSAAPDGMKFAPMPWILCGPALPCERRGDAAATRSFALPPGLNDSTLTKTCAFAVETSISGLPPRVERMELTYMPGNIISHEPSDENGAL